MEEHAIRNRIYSYIFYGLAAVALIASIFFYNPVLFVIALVLILLSALYYSSGHVLNNLLLKRSLLIETYNGYSLSDDLRSAVKRVGDSYYSVSIAVLRINRSIEAKSGEFLSLLESVNEPFSFSIELREVNKKALLETLETKRRMKEIAIARISGGSYDRINEGKRELSVIEQDIKSIRGNGKALEVRISLRASARLNEQAEAARLSSKNVERIAGSFSSMLSMSHEVLSGEALLAELEVS